MESNKKREIIFLLLVGLSISVNAVNVTFDAGHYQFTVYRGDGTYIGTYINSSVQLGLNDYILLLEERPLNMTEIDMIQYPINLIDEYKKSIVMLSAIILMVCLLAIFFMLALFWK